MTKFNKKLSEILNETYVDRNIIFPEVFSDFLMKVDPASRDEFSVFTVGALSNYLNDDETQDVMNFLSQQIVDGKFKSTNGN